MLAKFHDNQKSSASFAQHLRRSHVAGDGGTGGTVGEIRRMTVNHQSFEACCSRCVRHSAGVSVQKSCQLAKVIADEKLPRTSSVDLVLSWILKVRAHHCRKKTCILTSNVRA
eukprot:5724275-Amphidinium_carterae.1